MREMTAAAQPRLDTERGRGEVGSHSSAAITALFHTWHLRDRGLPTPRTFPSTLLWYATWLSGSQRATAAGFTMWQCFKGQMHPRGKTVNLHKRGGEQRTKGAGFLNYVERPIWSGPLPERTPKHFKTTTKQTHTQTSSCETFKGAISKILTADISLKLSRFTFLGTFRKF